MTGVETYQAVLRELKSEYTTSMTPSEFNHHIWVGLTEYVSVRYWAWEQHQKSIDDLRVIKVMTDGVAGMPLPLPNEGAAIAGQEYITIPANYKHLLNVAAQVKYIGEPCIKDGTLSNPIACSYLYDDQEKLVHDDYYKRPRPQFPNLYYTLRGQVMVFKAGKSIVQKVYLNYLRYPLRIAIDPITGANIQSSEFGDAQTYEIVKWCVHSYLEKIEEYRLQTMTLILGKQFDQFPHVSP